MIRSEFSRHLGGRLRTRNGSDLAIVPNKTRRPQID